jgi:hypothetical protein
MFTKCLYWFGVGVETEQLEEAQLEELVAVLQWESWM